MDYSCVKKKRKLSNMNENKKSVDSPMSIVNDVNESVVEEADKKIQNFIILHAWRQQRQKNIKLETSVKNLMHQIKNFKLQTYTLRQLLDAEKTRVIQVNNDLRKVLNILEESKFEKKALICEKEQYESRLKTIEDQLAIMENEYKNQKNELITARLEAQNWEKQLQKEREKLLRLKDEKKFLIEEVRFKGNLLVWQIRSFEQFSLLYNIFQDKPNNPALPWDDTFGRNDAVHEISKPVRLPRKQQTVIIVEKPLETPELKALLAKVERKTAEEDERTEELEKSISGKTKNAGSTEFLISKCSSRSRS